MNIFGHVHKIVNKLRETGSLRDKQTELKCRVLTEEKLDDIAARLENSPRKSLKRLAREAGVSKSLARNATKLLKLKPYKTRQDKTRQVHELQPRDPASRVNFCNWMLQSIHDGEIDPNLIFFSDEACFYLNG
jgi:hypothetical protein